jgi:endogenous inhibitor of DNA gyrase (YacG/DUF329 family)
MPISSSVSTSRPCPICGKPPLLPHMPFCSARCRQVDLGRWLTGRYAVETSETPEADERVQNDE